MTSTSSRKLRNYWTSEAPYHGLLVMLFTLLALHPLGVGRGLLTNVVMGMVLLGCIWTVAEERKLLTVALVLGLPATGLLFASEAVARILGPITVILTLCFVCIVFVGRIFKNRAVTSQSLSASMIVYIFLGVIWYEAYGIVERLYPGSFYGVSAANGVASEEELFYFSFVTLSTLGFGDIGPLSAHARSLVITEAIVGQLYLVVLVATLVGMFLAGPRDTDGEVS